MRPTRSSETTTNLFRFGAAAIVKGTYYPGGVFEIQFKIPVAGLLGGHGLDAHTSYLWRAAFCVLRVRSPSALNTLPPHRSRGARDIGVDWGKADRQRRARRRTEK